jgi:hypothetical protein
MRCGPDVGAMAEMTGLNWKCQKPDRKRGLVWVKQQRNDPSLTVGLLTLKRRGAGNDLDDFAGDGGLANAIHIQRQ